MRLASPQLSVSLANANVRGGRQTFMPRHGLAGSRALSLYLQRYLKGWLEEHKTTKADLARQIGISGAHVSNITNHADGVGSDVEEAVAVWMKITVDELRGKARAEFKDDGPGALELQVEDRYPNRTKAVEFMRPYVDPEAIERTLSEQLKADADPDPKWWADLIENFDRRVKLERSRPQTQAEESQRARDAGDEMERADAPKLRRKART